MGTTSVPEFHHRHHRAAVLSVDVGDAGEDHHHRFGIPARRDVSNHVFERTAQMAQEQVVLGGQPLEGEDLEAPKAILDDLPVGERGHDIEHRHRVLGDRCRHAHRTEEQLAGVDLAGSATQGGRLHPVALEPLPEGLGQAGQPLALGDHPVPEEDADLPLPFADPPAGQPPAVRPGRPLEHHRHAPEATPVLHPRLPLPHPPQHPRPLAELSEAGGVEPLVAGRRLARLGPLVGIGAEVPKAERSAPRLPDLLLHAGEQQASHRLVVVGVDPTERSTGHLHFESPPFAGHPSTPGCRKGSTRYH